MLLKNSNEVFRPEEYEQAGSASDSRTKASLSKWWPTPSVNLSAQRVLRRMAGLLDHQGCSRVLVVGGGRQREWLDPILKAAMDHRVVYTDIDTSADVDTFCDAHDLPFKDGSFDAVITTAVLEHVVDPHRVAQEMARVLRDSGLIYSELPFMQQVHEGAYDFTRFTLGGHRRLLHQFREVEVGMVAGPGTALVWALENFFLAFTARRLVRKLIKLLVRILFFPLKYADHWLVRNDAAMDGASCTYFLGAKAAVPVSDQEIISRYVGAKHMNHV